jgi:isoleucyl-tRNA synthetase
MGHKKGVNQMNKSVEKTEMPEWFTNHPSVQSILAERVATTLATRMEATRKIEVSKKERDEVIPKLQAELKVKEKEYLKTKAAMQAASDEFRASKAALLSEDSRISHEIGQQEQILIDTADPKIDEAIQFFRAKLDWLRSPGRISKTVGGSERDLFPWTKTVSAETNAPAVRSALAYCQSAIKELEKLKLSPALDIQKIEKLKDGIPRIDIYEEIQGEKPMERQAPTFFPRSDYEDELIERLLKKKV